MPRERFVYDRATGDLVSAAEHRAREEARASSRRFEFREPRHVRRGTYLWRNGRWVHITQLRRRARRRSDGIQVISDIDPYRTVAADIAKGGKRTVIGSRSEHREFLRRNGYTEVGNEFVAPKREALSRADRISDIKRAMAERGHS